MEETVLHPVDRDKITSELTDDHFLRITNKGNNKIYQITNEDAPHVMQEIGRLRELSYRQIGCGSGKSIDIDEYDVRKDPYYQLVVWDPRQNEIVGGYRYAKCSDYIDRVEELSMSHYFKLSKRFIENILPHSIELGRAWVNPAFQTNAEERKSIFALDNLWDGIGVVLANNKNIKYMYGKLTISANYHPIGRALILWLLNHYFLDNIHLVSPQKPINIPNDVAIAGIEPAYNNFADDYKQVASYLKKQGLTIPPLVHAYLGLSQSITTFGSTLNKELNFAFETGMMMRVADIHRDKFERYVKTPNQKYIRQTAF